jgi:hypothetical protein
MNKKSIFDELQDKEKGRIEESQLNIQTLGDTLKREGRKGLKKIYALIYPELKEIFEDEEKEPRYYRKLTALASQYSQRDKSPLLVFLPPKARERDGSEIPFSKDHFVRYLGLTPEQFFDYIAGPNPALIPLIDLPKSYEGNALYESLFNEWRRRLEDEKEEKRVRFPPLYANTLQEALARAKGGFTEFKEKLTDDFKRNFIRVASLGPYTYDEALDPMKPTEFFPERFAWFELVHASESVNEIKELLQKYEKHPTKEETLKLAFDYTFSLHQLLTAFFFYSKGCPVVYAPSDVDRAVNTFNKLIRPQPELLYHLPNIYLANMLAWLHRKLSKIPIPSIGLPHTSDPDEAFNVFRRSREEEKIEEGRTKVTKDISETIRATEELNPEEIAEKLAILSESAQKLTQIYRYKLAEKPRRVLTGICIGAEVTLGVLHPEVIPIIEHLLVIQGIEKVIIAPVLNKFVADSKFRQSIYGGVFGSLKIPQDIWQYGQQDLPIVHKKFLKSLG